MKWWLLAVLCIGLSFTPRLYAAPIPQDASDDIELSEEEARQIKTAERFFDVLLKNPRYGTALDRVYGHHVEFGSLDSFLVSLKQRTENESDKGAVWMLLGMFESQRGNDAVAVDALTQADTLRPQDALASYYLGQAQLRIGQSNEAIASFERAIERKPIRTDLLEIFQTLGRVHQRAQRTDQAMEVWQRLESLFPDDPRVLEQIAVTLAEEGQPALALPHYEKLASLVRDDYRRVVYQMTAAELTIKTGQRDAGLKSLEKVLQDLNPESWLYRDVRRRIDDVFLRSGDQDSLVKYYQNWLATHPEDVEGMARLAKFLASSARVPEATEWMEKTLKLAPSRADLRKTFIDQLVNDQRFTEATKQYEELIKAAPSNPDYLRDWGKLVLRNRDVPEAERKQEAIRIWNQILATRPDDALTVSQVADLFRQNKIVDQAEQLYRKAVELAPADPQYREYLGEFLHIQGRSEEAVTVWAGIAEGPRRSAENVSRLAEVYNSFGFSEKAILEIADAVKLAPKDFVLQIRAAEYHVKANKYDEALAFVETANALAASDDERNAVIQQRIEVLQASQQLDTVADEQLAKLKNQAEATTADWYLAARYLEAARRWPDATEAIDNAIKLDPKSIAAMTLAARIAETSGDYGRAAQMNRTLADIDRRSRGDHLMNVSRLEAQLGRTEEALKAAQELIVSAPGNTDNYEFYAQTCFRFGKVEEGLEALRKAVRINPNEPHLIMALAAGLADQLRTDEAIEVYWRAFDKSEEVEDKVGLTMKLTPLYQQINQIDKLIDRLERERREEDKRREMTICLAQAWHTAGDLGAARQELEGLLSEDTRDTQLLNQLAKLCEAATDLDAAVGYQRQLVAIAPGHETEFPLAKMLMASGQTDEAREIFVKLTQREEDPVRQMRSLDSLISQGNFEAAIGVIEPILAQNREDWELLYREGVAWASLEKTEEAINRFERILALRLPYDSLGRSAAEKLKQAQAKAKSENLRGITTAAPQKQSPLSMNSMASQVMIATGLTADNRYYGNNQVPPLWTPEAYGVTRMAAMGWLMRFENEAEAADKQAADKDAADKARLSIVDSIRQKAEQDNATQESVYDWLYAAQLKRDFPLVFEIARRMAKTGGKEEQQFFLTSLKLRHTDGNQTMRTSSAAAGANKTPLSEEDLQLVRECYTRLTQAKKAADVEAMYGGNIVFASNGQAYVLVGNSYTPLGGVFQGKGGYSTLLIEELRLAGCQDEALELLNQQLAEAKTAAELMGSMALLFTEERFDELPNLFERWHQAALKQIADAPVTGASRGSARSTTATSSANPLAAALNMLQQWTGKLGEEEENAQILSILERCLEVAEAEAKHRRLVQAAQTRKTQSSTPSSSSIGSMSVYYGKKQTRANLTFPPTSTWLDHSTCTLLFQVHEILKRNEVVSDLTDLLRKRLDEALKAANDNDRLLCNHLYLAGALWWAEEQDDAVEQMSQAAALVSDNLPMQFTLATMYETRGDFDEALSLMEKITPRDQKVLQTVELRVLQLAERLGDTERARMAAERLFGLRLDAQTQLGLVSRMQRLGMGAMADAILARAERTATNQASSLASLMMLYQGQGKTEQANQLAHMLLRKTTSPININLTSGRNPTRYSSSDSSLRNQALQLLQSSGGLKVLIEQAENQLQRSPDSIPAIQQLIEFYGQTKQKDEIRRIIEQGLQVRPKSPMLRMQFAKQLEQSGKPNEACDQYLELLKIKPDWVTDELYQIDRVFTQAKRKSDLVDGLSQINLKQISQPHYIIQTASSLLENDETLGAGLKLLERAFEAFPTYRQYLTQNIRNNEIWSNDRFYQFAKRMVLPRPEDIRNNPWIGLDSISSYRGNGEVDVFFHQMLKGVKATDKIGDLEEAISGLLEQHPKWHSGYVMLALIEMETERKQQGQTRLSKLLDDDAITKSIPSEACWIVGQELDRFDDTRELALKLFEQAIVAPTNNSMSQLQYSPISKLIDSFMRVGRKEEAKELLLKQLSSTGLDEYDQAYSSYQRIENSTWAAQRFVKMEFPVEAMKLYRGLLDKPEQLSAAASWNGRDSDYYEKEVDKGLATALDSVTEKSADGVVAQLLFIPETLKPSEAAIDLMVSMPDAVNLATGKIKSSYIELLKTLSSDPKTAERITARLAEMAKQHPNDLSIAIASTAWTLETKPKEAAAAVKGLVALTSDHPLEDVPEGRRPNSRQRREAALYIPLWLVARECLKKDDLQQEGMKLAQWSRDAASRQLGAKDSSAILFDWGKVLMDAGLKDEAEARWSELLELTTKRPGGRKPNDPPKTSMRRSTLTPWSSLASSLWSLSPAAVRHGLLVVMQFPPAQRIPTQAAQVEEARTGREGTANIPPLTLSQFRTVIAIAKASAENGMQELSRRAVGESLRGGFPVPDPTAADISGSMTRVISRSSSRGDINPIEKEVATSLESVLAVWVRKDFPSEETYTILKSLILPDNRPEEIRMYVTATDLSNAKITSMAESLIAAAVKAEKLDELRDAIAERQNAPAAKLPVAVMGVLIELQSKSIESADEKLELVKSNSFERLSTQDKHLAFLAALRAFDQPDLKAKAFPVLRGMLQSEMLAKSGQNQEVSISGELASLVNRHLAETGDEKSLNEYFEQLISNRQSHYSRYSGDYGLYIQRNDLVALAQQASTLGITSLALDYLGRAADFVLTQYGEVDLSMPLAVVVRQLRTLPAQERYASWLAWTLPTEGRQSIRAVHEGFPPNIIPKTFTTESQPYETQIQDHVLSNFTELVDAAKQVNQLDELRSLVQPLVAGKQKHADILLALILIAQDDVKAGVPQVESLQASFAERMKTEATGNPNARSQPPSTLADYLVIRACLQSPAFVNLFGDQLPAFRNQLQNYSSADALRVVNFDWASRASSPAVPDAVTPSDPMTHWIPKNVGEGSGDRPPWWSVYQDQVVSLNGSETSDLVFRYPLTGNNFTVSVDCFHRNGTGGSASFGGVLMNVRSARFIGIRSLSGHESINRNMPAGRSGITFNRVTMEVKDGIVRHLLNNQLVYQEPIATTAPWLNLTTSGSRASAYRNLQFSGDIVVPDSVSLIDGNQMDGWRCDAFRESQPRKRLMKETPTSENDSIAYFQREEPTEFDWSAVDGILKGRAKASAPSDQQSWIYYQRPLLDGETFEYEFYYSVGNSVAHPTIGQVALVLEPDGVSSHWIATERDQKLHGLSPTNTIVETDILRGPTALPLKSEDWNRVELQLQGNFAVVSLNGTIVCERPLEPAVGRRLGLFRYAKQASQVRNVVLRGDWPKTLPSGSEWLAVDKPSSPEAALSVATIIDDETIALLAGDVVATARSMDAEAGYAYLSDWVLPSATHRNIRLHFSQVSNMPESGTSDDFGFDRFVSPAVELARFAVQQGKAEALMKTIEQLSKGAKSQQRAASALRTIVALEANIDEAIKAGLADAWNAVAQPYPTGTTARERTSEFLVAWRAAQHPVHWSVGNEIAQKLSEYERKKELESGDADFKRQVLSLAGMIEHQTRATAYARNGESANQTSQWTSVPYVKPEHRWGGYRTSTWLLDKGSAQHMPADTWNQLFFQSPLRGKFEIVAHRTTHGNKEVSIAWGMHNAEPTFDVSAVNVDKVMHSSKKISKKIELPFWDQQADFRIVVDDRTVTTWTNGVQIHKQTFERAPDPWLLLQARNAGGFSRVSNLRILGTPEIPSEIDLINTADLAGWRADIYNEQFRSEGEANSDDQSPWLRTGEELVGQRLKNSQADHRESLLMYQRPMLEDGEIEFETWYEPGEFEVHPALGRHAFMLTADGVRLHRLTDAQYETSGLAADNQESIPEAATSLTLKPNDWNQVKLTLRGDQLTIVVNGEEAAKVQVSDAPNVRQFGLFRYSNLTQSRVRKLVYRGEWPKELPVVEAQDLATSVAGTKGKDSRFIVDGDLSQPETQLNEMKLSLRGSQEQRRINGEGLQINMRELRERAKSPGIAYPEPIDGDCEVTVSYKDLQMSPAKTGWGVNLVLELVLDDLQQTRVKCSVGMDKGEKPQFSSQIQRNQPAGVANGINHQALRPGSASGKLRMTRRGGQVDCYVAREDSDEFVHFNSLAVGPGTIRSVSCVAASSDEVAKLDVILTRITISPLPLGGVGP